MNELSDKHVDLTKKILHVLNTQCIEKHTINANQSQTILLCYRSHITKISQHCSTHMKSFTCISSKTVKI